MKVNKRIQKIYQKEEFIEFSAQKLTNYMWEVLENPLN